MALYLADKVVEYLTKNPEQKFTARQIAEWVLENYPEECREKQERSTATVTLLDNDKGLMIQLVSEIGASRLRIQKKCPKIKITEERPRKFYYTESTDDDEVSQAESSTKVSSGRATSKKSLSISSNDTPKEHELYPILSQYLYSEFGVLGKRIDEKRSSNSRGPGGNRWLYPDLVGMEDLSQEWHREVKDCVQQYADKKTKLWSFEVKILIKRSNAREAFFQAVSNSSWANFGYLVAKEISEDALKELRILSGLHGIGFIRLDVENPSESEIMLPSREKSDIDWHTVNRLAQENSEFLDYVKLVRQFYQTGETDETAWDVTPLGD